MQTVSIAGATGYLGRYTMKALKEAGYRVRVLAQMGVGLSPAITDKVDEIHMGDMT